MTLEIQVLAWGRTQTCGGKCACKTDEVPFLKHDSWSVKKLIFHSVQSGRDVEKANI
jgi:hypothetical protein